MERQFLYVLLLEMFSINVVAQSGFQKYYATNGDVRFHTVCETNDNNLLLAGFATRTTSLGLATTPLLTKTNILGQVTWSLSAEISLEFRSIEKHLNDKYVVVGRSSGGGLGGNDIFVGLVDGSGDFLWNKVLGGSGNDFGYDVAVYPNGDILICGVSGGINGSVVKLSGIGDLIWTARYSLSGVDEIFGIITTSDGGAAFCGRTTSISGAGGNDWWAAKIDTNGEVEWSKSYGGFQSDIVYDILQTSDGGYILCGSVENIIFNSQNAALVKTNSSGDVQWAKVFGSDGDDRGNSVVRIDGGYRLFGLSDTLDSRADILTIDVNDNGDVLSSRIFGGSDSREVIETNQSAIVTNSSHTFVSGLTERENAEYGFLLSIDVDDFSGCNETSIDIPQASFSPVVGIGNHQKSVSGDIANLMVNWETLNLIPTSDCGPNGILKTDNPNMLAYPNPTTGIIQVSINDSKRHNYSLLNSFGVIVSKGIIAGGTSTIDVSNLSAGIYFILTDSGQSQTFAKVD